MVRLVFSCLRRFWRGLFWRHLVSRDLFWSGVLGALLLIGSATAAVAPAPAQKPAAPLTSEHILSSLNKALAWYRQARIVMHAADTAGGGLFTREDQQTALTVLQRAFDVARAQAARLPQAQPAAAAPSANPAAQRRAALQAAIQSDEESIVSLRRQLQSAPSARRQDRENQLAAAINRRDLDRTRLDLLAEFEQFDSSVPQAAPDLTQQIQALQDSVPELRAGIAGPDGAMAPLPTPAGTRATVHHLIDLARARSGLSELTDSTGGLLRSTDEELRGTHEELRPIVAQLRKLATDPAAVGRSLAEDANEFHDLLHRARLLGAVVAPLRQKSSLLRRFVADLQAWEREVNRDTAQTLQSLAVGLVGVVIALAGILVGAVLWRVATVRYIQDAYRRHLLLMTRNATVIVAIVLVLMLHFSSELAALVTGLGFAAAGVAFALQTVILAVAGYFSIVAPNGIRVGDRVSLQGPFGFVHGQVLEIGLLRLRLQELAGEPLRPTGRVVVFPNSVVFTGSFFKHPPNDARPQAPRSAEPGAVA